MCSLYKRGCEQGSIIRLVALGDEVDAFDSEFAVYFGVKRCLGAPMGLRFSNGYQYLDSNWINISVFLQD